MADDNQTANDEQATQDNQAKVSGTIYRFGLSKRVANVAVRATWAGKEPIPPEQDNRTAFSDAHGVYAFDERLQPGVWNFVAFDVNGSRTLTEVEIPPGQKDLDFELTHTGNIDQAAGENFRRQLFLYFIALAVVYLILHLMVKSGTPADNLQVNVAAAQSIVAKKQTDQKSDALNKLIEQIAAGLEQHKILADELNNLRNYLNGGVVANNDLAGLLKKLSDAVAGLEKPSFLWAHQPWVFLEILFWGCAGILTHLIVRTGGYLRWQRFYKEGIFQHISQLLTVPLMALVTIMLLTQAEIQLTLAQSNTVTLRLSEPVLVAAIAYIISLRPFKLWGFLEEKSDAIFDNT